jgi:hypothetical protein
MGFRRGLGGDRGVLVADEQTPIQELEDVDATPRVGALAGTCRDLDPADGEDRLSPFVLVETGP